MAEQTTSITVPGSMSTTSMVLPRNLTYPEWCEVGQKLRLVREGHQWWIGDYLVYGEGMYQEVWVQGAEDALKFPEKSTYVNYAWVARSVTADRRRDELSWTHHAEVAGMEAHEQEQWLQAAIDHSWSVREFRAALQTAKKSGEVEGKVRELPACGQCGLNVDELREKLAG